ncbi:MAG: hypothetical protein AAF708_00285 [Deinococcota bacterium]
MTQQEWLAFLQELDTPGDIEYPSDINIVKSIAKDFELARDAIDKRLELKLKSTVTQDASFYGDLKKVKDYDHWFSMRFSYFGRLFTVRGTPQSYLDSLPLTEIINLLEDMKFVYVPMEILELPYEGPNKVWRIADDQPPQWWDRYFSYV